MTVMTPFYFLNIFYALGNLPGDASDIVKRFLLLEILRVQIYFLCSEYYCSNCSTVIAPLLYATLRYSTLRSSYSTTFLSTMI